MTTVYWIVGFLVVWAILIAIAGLTLGRTGEVAVVFRFGTFYRVLLPKTFPYFTIPLIDRVERYSTQVHQHELPDEPENIDRLNDIALPGKKLPFRIPHKGMAEAVFYVRKEYDVNTRTGDPFDSSRSMGELKRVRFSELPDAVQTAMQEDSLNAPLTSEAASVFEWRLKSEEAHVRDFIQNISPEEGRTREEEVRKRAEDMITRTLQEYLAPTTLGHAIEMAPLFNRLVRERLEELVGEGGARAGGSSDRPWGIHVGEAYLKPIHPGHTINDARAKAGATISNKFGTIRDAEAESAATRVKADANAFAEQRKGEGEAARIGAMTAVMRGNDDARFLAALDVAAEVLPKANLVIMPSDLGAIGGILALGGEISKNKKGGEPEKK